MKEKLSVAGQILVGVVLGNLVGKGMEVVAEKAKKAVENKKKGKVS